MAESKSGLDLQTATHRRLNPLTGEWVLVSPQRTARPWQGQVETAAAGAQPSYEPSCYLCPGNARADGSVNPHYESTLVFDNDFAALRPQGAAAAVDHVLLQARSESGICRVISYSPRHDLSMGHMAVSDILGATATPPRSARQLPVVRVPGARARQWRTPGVAE